MSFTISYARLSLHSPSRCRCSGTMRPYHLFVVHFPRYKRERNESSGRRPGGHFRRKKPRWNEEKGTRERAKRLLKAEEREEKENRRVGSQRGMEGKSEEHPITGANTRATVIARPRPYLLFTWLPALCTPTTIPFQRPAEPLETLARTRIASYVADLRTRIACAASSCLFLCFCVCASPSLSFSYFLSFSSMLALSVSLVRCAPCRANYRDEKRPPYACTRT